MSKQFKKYLILYVDNSKQKNMADKWFPGLGKSETHCSCFNVHPPSYKTKNLGKILHIIHQ